jgi:DNA-binding transcriptional ArsR family regulator
MSDGRWPPPTTGLDDGLDDGLDYALDDTIHADTPARLKALGDPLRLLILDLVLEHAMTVSELAERTVRPKGTVGYHVDVLVAAGLLQVVRTRRVRAVEERFYGRAARTVVFPDHGEIPFMDAVLRDIDLERTRDHVEVSTFTFRHARIPRERAAEFAKRLDALALEFIAEPRGGDVEYGMYVALFPTNRLARAAGSGTAPPPDQETSP